MDVEGEGIGEEEEEEEQRGSTSLSPALPSPSPGFEESKLVPDALSHGEPSASQRERTLRKDV